MTESDLPDDSPEDGSPSTGGLEAESEPASDSDQRREGSGKESGKSRRQRVSSRRKRWLFRLGAVVLPLAVLSVVEVVLLATGVGADLALVVPVEDAGDILRFQINSEADRAWCPGQGMAGPEPRRFDLPKPDGTFRIVVVGASTVQGFPYASELAFPRQLELLLNLQQSRRNVEVLNLGVTGVSTAVVREILVESLNLQPDLIIIHAGHNEFYGVGGVASTIGTAPQFLMKASAVVRRTRTVQTLSQLLLTGIPEDRDPIEALPADLDIPLTDSLVSAAETAYRSNLKAMVQAARSWGVPVVLSTVAANCRSHSPVSQFLPEGLADADLTRWRTAFDEGRRLTADGDFAGALEQFETATEISSESSLMQYRRAQCLLALGRTVDADEAFRLAADLDGCRFRALSSFARIVADVSGEAHDEGVMLVDTADSIRKAVADTASTTSRLPVFVEHVHYSRHGHSVLAETFAKEILAQFLNGTWDESLSVGSTEFSGRLGPLVEDDLAALSFALELYNREPMRNAFDAQRHQQLLVQRITGLFAELSPESREDFSALTMEQMSGDMLMHLADRIEQSGDRDRLLEVLRQAVLRQPWSADRCQRLVQTLKTALKSQPDLRSELERQSKSCLKLSIHQESL